MVICDLCAIQNCLFQKQAKTVKHCASKIEDELTADRTDKLKNGCQFSIQNRTFLSRSEIHSDEGLTLETSVFESFTVANLPYRPCG